MKITSLGLFGIVTIASFLACQPASVITSVDKGFRPEARSYQKADLIYVEVKVPHLSGVNTWQAKFVGEAPDGFVPSSTNLETVFTWIVPKNRITWFGTDGYTMVLSSGEYSRTVQVKAINKTSSIIQSVICTILPFAH